MKILIVPDKFKGSMSAKEVCEAIGNGLKKEDSTIETISHPMADGGDGSIEILSTHFSLKKIEVKTVDPIGREISTHYFTSSGAAPAVRYNPTHFHHLLVISLSGIQTIVADFIRQSTSTKR